MVRVTGKKDQHFSPLIKREIYLLTVYIHACVCTWYDLCAHLPAYLSPFNHLSYLYKTWYICTVSICTYSDLSFIYHLSIMYIYIHTYNIDNLSFFALLKCSSLDQFKLTDVLKIPVRGKNPRMTFLLYLWEL